ncbi:hypothetical protein HDU98_008464 [Podochytrium sp. JEL0797]|nr:hypothetical protein HDU98_008464 [Podochytrium sp. JEL0797]
MAPVTFDATTKQHVWDTALAHHARCLAALHQGNASLMARHASASLRLLDASLLLPLANHEALRVRLLQALVLLDTNNLLLAEQAIQKAVLLNTAAANNPPLRFLLASTHASLQSRLSNSKHAKQLLHHAQLDAAQHSPHWYAYLVSLRVDLLLAEGDVRQAHAVLASVVEKGGWVGVAACVRRLAVCVEMRDFVGFETVVRESGIEAVLEGNEASNANANGDANANANSTQIGDVDSNGSKPPPPPPPPHVSIAPDLVITYRILKTMASLLKGDRRRAKALVDFYFTNLAATRALEDAFFASRSNGGVNGSEVDARSLVKGLTRRQQDAVMCLMVAGVVRDSETQKAVEFLNRGVEIVQEAMRDELDASCTSLQDVLASRQWFMELHALCLHQLVETNLLKGDIDSAEQTLNTLITHLHSTTHACPLLQKHVPTLLLDWGLIHQSRGRLREASRCYFGAAALAGEVAHQYRGERGVVGCVGEVRILASFCNVVVLVGSGEVERVELAKQILQELQKDILDPLIPTSHYFTTTPTSATPMTPSTQKSPLTPGGGSGASAVPGTSSLSECEHTKSFVSLCSAMMAHQNGEIKKTKSYLLETLRQSDTLLSNRLKIVTLVFLGNVFLESDVGQTEKMVHTAYKLSKKYGGGGGAGKSGGVVGKVCLSVLEELARRKKK